MPLANPIQIIPKTIRRATWDVEVTVLKMAIQCIVSPSDTSLRVSKLLEIIPPSSSLLLFMELNTIVTPGSFELIRTSPINHSMKEPEGELRTSQVKLALSPAVTVLLVGLVMNIGSTEDTEMNSITKYLFTPTQSIQKILLTSSQY